MASVASSRLDRRSWPLSSRRCWMVDNCFEAEDVSRIPEFYIAKPLDLLSPQRVNLMTILQIVQKPKQSHVTVGKNMHNLTIENRRGTFQRPWTGPPAGLMAECGLYKVSEDSATCYACGITLRCLTPATCVWTHHHQFSPSCLHLKRAKTCNPQQLEGGQQRYVRHLSADDSIESGLGVSML